ncbi:MAG: calcium-binding protein [Solirubrobacterales bacterium]|nr:calcium-binding protein [Solirubrobacterales bacterium]
MFGSALLVALAAATALAAHPARQRQATVADCLPIPPGVKCQPGLGKHAPGGSGSTSHAGWPGFTGIRWQVISNSNTGETRVGTQWNDELLGRNGSDHLSGGAGRDVIWGDSNATVNGPGQHDVLDGGPGADWIYASHGSNVITGGPGNDHITAAFGHGTIDCGPGSDHYKVRGGGHYTVRNCEHKGR